MDKLIASFEKYSIYLLSQNGLLALSKFVINENYERHKINNKRSNVDMQTKLALLVKLHIYNYYFYY